MSRRSAFFFIPCLSLGVCLPVYADWKDDIGFTELQTALGAGTPKGTGITVTQIEADADVGAGFSYLTDTTNGQFAGKTITDGSGLSTSASSHATNVGLAIYGNTTSIAPAITQIKGFELNDWLNNQLNMSGGDPAVETSKLQNNSWAAEFGVPATDLLALQRHDFQVNRDGFISIAGVSNVASDTQSALLSNSYNTISVGLTSGNHRYGTTTVNGAGREKPDIVAPNGATSYAAAIVSSAASILLETAGATAANKPETMRAILLAGATKNDVAGTWSHTTTQPLDSVYGAGEVNVFNSYYIVTGGEHEGTDNAAPGSLAPQSGWDYQAGFASPGTTTRYYNFEVAAGQIADEFSIILSWNSDVTDTDAGAAFVPLTTLANMDLEFYDSTSSFLGTKLTESVSLIDNVEHIYLTALGAGTYTLAVKSDTDWDFGLGWRMNTSAIPEPGALPLLALTCLIFTRRHRPPPGGCHRWPA